MTLNELRNNISFLEDLNIKLFDNFELIDDDSFTFYENITELIYDEIERETKCLKNIEGKKVFTND
jgi:hypothetical protein